MTNEQTIEARLQHAIELLDGDRDAFVSGQPFPLTASDEEIAGEYLSAIDAIQVAVSCIEEMEGFAKEQAAEIAALKADAGRYRWLKSTKKIEHTDSPDLIYASGYSLRGEAADKVIDAAMNAGA